MPVNIDDPTIPAACAPRLAPDLNAAVCSEELNYGLISNLYIGTQDPLGAFVAPPTAVEIARRLALPLTSQEALRLLIGEMTFGTASPQTEPFNGRNVPAPGMPGMPGGGGRGERIIMMGSGN